MEFNQLTSTIKKSDEWENMDLNFLTSPKKEKNNLETEKKQQNKNKLSNRYTDHRLAL